MPNKIEQGHFGKTRDGKEISRFKFSNLNNVTVEIINFGCYITSINVPDRNGKFKDIALGYNTIEEYEDDQFYLNSVVGRCANRICKGKFTIDGETHQLNVNNGPNHLHGGLCGFNKKVWEAEVHDTCLILSYTSPDMEENYPGALTVHIRYELTDDNEFNIHMTAETTKTCPVNMTQHTYFNLAGHDHGNVYDHLLTLYCDKFTPKDGTGIPLGEMAPVSGSVYDFRQPSSMGKHINEVPGDIGYDHSYRINDPSLSSTFARVEDPASGRVLEVSTNQPSVHLYSGNYLDCKGKDGSVYKKHAGFCLEQQNFPDAINQPNFPDCLLRPGKKYLHDCVYRFSIKK
ncbi:galactose mutarotase-like [Lineus longissimus]|uniref:galactose mutarotase-like n=1 Tax=Lineus longissimus TaxID=88925 RepID=UPI002B4F54D1